jgi:DMSO/TMAO reductase YedYZ heme-binding membrane subunit
MGLQRQGFGGPRLVGLSAVIVGGLCGALLAVPEPGPEQFRATIRVTAFTSAVLFLLAFTASALARVRPGSTTRWLLANRRYLGLSFAVSHLAHLLAIVALARSSPAFLESVKPATVVGGGLGFALIAAMAATSNDASVRLLGRGWHVLHTVGVYYLWVIFALTYSGPARVSLFHAAMTLVLVAALGLRVAGRGAPWALQRPSPAGGVPNTHSRGQPAGSPPYQ